MGWAENRVREFRAGKPASWLERRMLERANPVHFVLAAAAGAGVAAGLWMHDLVAISGAALLALVGHVFCWTRKPGRAASDDAENSARVPRRYKLPPSRRAGLLVRALSGYGSLGRARLARQVEDHLEPGSPRDGCGRNVE